jgi:hypothetical protein
LGVKWLLQWHIDYAFMKAEKEILGEPRENREVGEILSVLWPLPLPGCRTGPLKVDAKNIGYYQERSHLIAMSIIVNLILS